MACGVYVGDYVGYRRSSRSGSDVNVDVRMCKISTLIISLLVLHGKLGHFYRLRFRLRMGILGPIFCTNGASVPRFF